MKLSVSLPSAGGKSIVFSTYTQATSANQSCYIPRSQVIIAAISTAFKLTQSGL